MLASLAMLAPKAALRVAPGGSAPLFPSVPRRGQGVARSGRESRLVNRTGKRDCQHGIQDGQEKRLQGGSVLDADGGSIFNAD